MRRGSPRFEVFAVATLLLLTGCVTTASQPNRVPDIYAVKAFIAAEGGFDAAVITADAAIRSGRLVPSTVARIRAVTDTGHAYVLAARAAVRALDAAGLAAKTDEIVAIASALAALGRI